MPTDTTNLFGARASLRLGSETAVVYHLAELARQGLADLDRLPFSIRVLLENALRHAGRGFVTDAHVRTLAGWSPRTTSRGEVPFMPARVVLQDFTGVPCVVDLAAMRDAMGRMRGDPDQDQPGRAVRSGHRPLGAGRLIRLAAVPQAQRGAGVRAEPRAVRSCSSWAQQALRQLPGGPARHRHRPPGQPRIPGPGGPAPARSSAS